MKKHILFIACVIVTIILSIGTISANDNVTDSYTAKSTEDTTKDTISTKKLETESSNNLPANTVKSTSNNVSNSNSNTANTEYKTADEANTVINNSSTVKSSDKKKYYKGSTKYSAEFLNTQGEALSNTNVKITVSSKTYTVKTNAKGVASLNINLKPGTYKVTAKNPVTGYSLTNTFKILTTISAKNIVKVYTDGKKFYATFLKSNGKTLAKKYIKFKVAGKTYKIKTNAKGVASLSLTKLKKGTYKIVSYNSDGLTRTNTIKVLGTSSTKIVTNSYTYLVKNVKYLKNTLKNSLGYGVKGKTIIVKVNGRTYTGKTNANGVATVKLGYLKKGLYTVTYRFYRSGVYKASSTSNKLMILNNNNAAYTVKSATSFTKGQTNTFKVALTASGIALSKRTMTLKVDNQTYVKTTDNKGIVSVPINLNTGNHVITYSYKGESKINAKTGSTTIQIKDPNTNTKLVSINDIIDSAANLKKYYETNKKLPNTVTSAGHAFTLPEFLYLMTKATHQLGNENMADITSIIGVAKASAPSGDNINSKNLYKNDYLTVANNIAKYIETNKIAPNYATSSVGKIIYSELVDAFSRGLNFYKENKTLPNYIIISTADSSSDSSVIGVGLNYVEALSASQIETYLKATSNCQVNDASISSIVASVTNGLTSDYDKANAIFKYVRDTLSYSFYYNTKYGAVKTLSAKQGNCVDHTHLIIAMCRNAGIAARYVHGEATFTSGSRYGHVWAQVYVNGKWYVADGTSTRNSFGTIANWNTNTFKLNNIYKELPF